MTNWKYKVNLKPFWGNEEMSIEEKGKLVAKEIYRVFPNGWFNWESKNYNEEIEQIAEAFENITGYDDVTPVEEFDNWMEALYDFGDTPTGRGAKMAWIATTF